MKTLKVALSKLASIALVSASLAIVPTAPALATGCSNSGAFASGDGSVGSPYLISTPGQLQYFIDWLTTANTTGKVFKLTNNINMQNCTLTTSGNAQADRFAGTFDGMNYEISNFVVFEPSAPFGAGLISRTVSAVIQNLKVSGANVGGMNFVGAIVGQAQETSLINLSVENSEVWNASGRDDVDYFGGVAGCAETGSGKTLNRIRVVQTSVSGPEYVGGAFGYIAAYGLVEKILVEGATITSSFASDKKAGGVIGGVFSGAVINELGFQGTVNATPGQGRLFAGGLLIGTIRDTAVTLSDSYSVGTYSSLGTQPAGLVGEVEWGGSVSLSRVYSRATFPKSDNSGQLTAHPLASSATSVTASFYGNQQDSVWASTSPSSSKTDVQLRDIATYSGASWSISSDSAALRAGTLNTAWFISQSMNSGFPMFVWAYNAGVYAQTPCTVGTFHATTKVPCDPTPVGTYTNVSGASAPMDCPVGTYQNLTGQMLCFQADPGNYVEDPGSTTQTPCQAGTFQPNNGARECLPAQIGFIVTSPGQAAATACQAGTSTSGVGMTTCDVILQTQYLGPLVTGSVTVTPGGKATLKGTGLAGVTKVTVDGVECRVDAVSDTSLAITVPASLGTGTKDLVITSRSGSLTVQGALVVSRVGSIAATGSSIKRIGDKVRFAISNAVGVGKIQFLVNGKEVAWVRAVDGSNPKLRNGQYFVRTTKLVSGKNMVEIRVAGKILDRASLTR